MKKNTDLPVVWQYISNCIGVIELQNLSVEFFSNIFQFIALSIASLAWQISRALGEGVGGDGSRVMECAPFKFNTVLILKI